MKEKLMSPLHIDALYVPNSYWDESELRGISLEQAKRWTNKDLEMVWANNLQIAEALKEMFPDMKFYFGSETDTLEKFAEDVKGAWGPRIVDPETLEGENLVLTYHGDVFFMLEKEIEVVPEYPELDIVYTMCLYHNEGRHTAPVLEGWFSLGTVDDEAGDIKQVTMGKELVRINEHLKTRKWNLTEGEL
jgi:hypothetical protein